MKSNSHLAPLEMKYRPDIDGLRAIAVIGVLVFHAFPDYLRGGFIGVDVFFVLSGYLISTIIFKELDRGDFSFTRFYGRRIRRIFPALLLVLVVCGVFGWFVLWANEYRQLGKHIAGGATFISNFILWNEVGYFDNAVETKPLLHLWSLGVEEQFYIFWPLLLWAAWKRKINFFWVIAFIAASSFVLNVNQVYKEPIATFYSPLTRLWELLAGSALAWIASSQAGLWIHFNVRTEKNRLKNFVDTFQQYRLVNFVSPIGVILIAYGFWNINKELSFPGKWALVPVVGAILIIISGPTSWVNRSILSSKLLVWIGLISFPLYLWHWPLLAFARIIGGDTPAAYVRVAALLLSTLFAWFTYSFVERFMRHGPRHKLKTLLLCLLMMIVGLSGYNIYMRNGLEFRNANKLKKFSGDIGQLEYHRKIAQQYFICTPQSVAKEALRWEGFIRCMQSKSSSNVDIALLGDSHAEHLFLGMAEALPEKNIVFYIRNGIPLISNPEFKNIYNAIASSKTIKTVVLTMFWNHRYSQLPPGISMEASIIDTIDLLTKSGKKVYLVDDVPSFRYGPEECNGRPLALSNQSFCQISLEEANRQSKVYEADLLRVTQARPEVKILRVKKFLCNDLRCSMVIDNQLLYRDKNHLNLNGSSFVGRSLVEDNPGTF